MPSASCSWAPETPAGPAAGPGGNGSLQPVFVEALAWQDPEAVFRLFQHDHDIAWLDSQGDGGRARYSYLCVEPFEVRKDGCPFTALDEFCARFARQVFAASVPVPFAGGAVGFLGYECAAWLERLPTHRPAFGQTFWIGFYDVIFAWDHLRRRLWIISNGLPETDPAAQEARAHLRAREILQRLASNPPPPLACPNLTWRQLAARATHEARVARAIDYIRSGDIFQANISARFSATRPTNLHQAAIHLALRAANPAPYGAFLACGPDLAIASVSPERFVGLARDGTIEARPIKGTRPRAKAQAEDNVLAAELRASLKDHAENLMIVDLLRNDIGRVAQFGSVHVPELAALESFAHVHHLVSCVRATLRPGATAADLLRATFPGGSITGAPKIRAIEIIHELEQTARGPYCGSLFWLGPDGAMDSSILIRTATITPENIVIQGGGGIVADSEPAAEYEEALVKVRPLLRALGKKDVLF